MEKFNINQNLDKPQKIPSNIDAEQNVLGSVLVNNDTIDEIASIINSQKKSVVVYLPPLKIFKAGIFLVVKKSK